MAFTSMRVLLSGVVATGLLTSIARATPPISNLSQIIAGNHPTLDPNLSSAVVMQAGATLPSEQIVNTLCWLYPAKYDPAIDKLTSITRGRQSLTARGAKWQEWFSQLNADVPQIPQWAQNALQSGQIFGELRNIGDTLWITFSSEDAQRIVAQDPNYWPHFNEQKLCKLFGDLRLLPNALVLRVHAFDDDKLKDTRELKLPAVVTLQTNSREANWVRSLTTLREQVFWTSLKDDLKLMRLFEWSKFSLSRTSEARSSLTQEYNNWLATFVATLGDRVVISMSPVEALRLTQSSPNAPWSAIPEIKSEQGRTLCRIVRKAWRPELNIIQGARIQRGGGPTSVAIRGQMAQALAETDEYEPFASSVLALECLRRGTSIQPATSVSALRIMDLYHFQTGEHSPDAILNEGGLLNSFLLNEAQSPRRADGHTWDYGPMICYLHPQRTLRKITIEERKEVTISSVGGNDEYPFATGTDQRKPYDFGANLASMVWTNFREDEFEKLGNIEGGIAVLPQIALVLTFPSGPVRRDIELAPLGDVKRVKIKDMASPVRLDVKRGFDDAIAKLKKEAKPAVP